MHTTDEPVWVHFGAGNIFRGFIAGLQQPDSGRVLLSGQDVTALPPDKREVTVTYFVPDKRKEGGAYRTASGRLERVDAEGGRLILEGSVCIRTEQITDIEKST